MFLISPAYLYENTSMKNRKIYLVIVRGAVVAVLWWRISGEKDPGGPGAGHAPVYEQIQIPVTGSTVDLSAGQIDEFLHTIQKGSSGTGRTT
jgi:hypothetical protein